MAENNEILEALGEISRRLTDIDQRLEHLGSYSAGDGFMDFSRDAVLNEHDFTELSDESLARVYRNTRGGVTAEKELGDFRPMNEEFGDRIHDFLQGGYWWKKIQQAKEMDPSKDLVNVILENIQNLTDEDHVFARSMNWAISDTQRRTIDVESMYDDGNWWYGTAEVEEIRDAAGLVAVTGHVILRGIGRSTSDSAALKRAVNLVCNPEAPGDTGLVRKENFVSRITPRREAPNVVGGTIFITEIERK